MMAVLEELESSGLGRDEKGGKFLWELKPGILLQLPEGGARVTA